MDNRISYRFVGYLFSFMLLFDIKLFELVAINDETIKARINWEDDGSEWYEDVPQEIEWDVPNDCYLGDAVKIAQFLIDAQLIRGDKIIVDREKLLALMNWEQKRFDQGLKSLLDIRVEMIDDGKRTDFYFVHF